MINQGLGGANPDSQWNCGDAQPVNIPAPEQAILESDAVKLLERIIGFQGRSNPIASRIRLPRKAFQELIVCPVRTANRHRWVGVSVPR